MKNGAPPLPPREERGPGAPRRVCRAVGAIAVHAYAFADEDDLRGPVYLYVATAGGVKKNGFSDRTRFFCQLACAHIACA